MHPRQRLNTHKACLLLRAGLLCMLLLLPACATQGERDRSEPGLRPLGETEADRAGELRLELSAEPVQGDAPLTVQFEARLVGEVDAAAGYDCPTLAWTLDGRDDGQVVLAQAADCQAGQVARVFRLEHRYERARAYEASLNLIGLEPPSSNLVQILVEGPTATPAPQVAQPGPTIVIATPIPASTRVADLGPTRARDAAPTRAGGQTDTARASATPAATTAGSEQTPSPEAIASETAITPRQARVLPADLYYLDAGHRALWRLNASGQGPDTILPPGETIEAYAIASDGRIAYSRDGRLMLAEGNSSRVLTDTTATALSWSRDGQQIAFSSGADLFVYEPAARRSRSLGVEAEPLAWSPDGRRLLALSDRAVIMVTVSADALEQVSLPLTGVRSAGWLSTGRTAWLAGEGLRLLSFEPAFALTEILPPEMTSEEVFARADDRLLTVVDVGDARQTYVVDLSTQDPRVATLGPELDIPELMLAWAPGGRFAALAGPEGLSLFDPIGGVQLPLLRRPASRPSWHLSVR